MKKLLLMIACAMALGAQAQQKTDGAEHNQWILAVDEYCPAPGQFINEMPQYEAGDDATTMAAKCTASIGGDFTRMASGDDEGPRDISLGSYGGYVTFHFDHSIANKIGERDFCVMGNSFALNSEPGIVMVSKDVNHNGLPDDPWYELAGSCQDATYGYEITYTPAAMSDIPWSDNQGGSGVIARHDGEDWAHAQEFFPLWQSGPLTFRGTRLPNNGVQTSVSPERWERNAFDWGYADDQPRIGEDKDWNFDGNSFDISWAVNDKRQSVYLDFIDFVRVYSAVNQDCGWLGETSTEVSGAFDRHLEESLNAIDDAQSGIATFEETLLADESYWNGTVGGEEYENIWGMNVSLSYFESGGFKFTNLFSPDYFSWSGFAVSNQTDNTYTSWDDQYKNCVGGGHDGSRNFCVAYPSYDQETIEMGEDGATVTGFYITNSAWNVDAYLNGDGMTPGAFGTGDWCKLTITGEKSDGTLVTKDVYLADYRSEDPSEHYYINSWKWVDLSGFGAVKNMYFEMSSSRFNSYGMTTPGYFCMDDFNGVSDGSDAIAGITGESDAHEVARYSIDGKKLTTPQKGLNIVRMSDGKVVKVIK